MRPSLMRGLERRGLGWAADDVIDIVTTELVARVARSEPSTVDSEPVRVAWLSDEEPSDEDAEAFRMLVRRWVRLRALDQLRRQYAQQRLVRNLATSHDAPAEAVDLDVIRYLEALSVELDALPADERDFVLSAGEERALPKTNAERQRLFRLRQRIAKSVRNALENPKKRGKK
jgi:hypothetical protein